MPYIYQEYRERLNPAIQELSSKLQELGQDSRAGNLNYTFSCLINSLYPKLSYSNINEIIGVLECCKQEFYFRVSVPYESKKKLANGDVYTYEICKS